MNKIDAMADAKKRNRWSRFGLTINTNQRILREDAAYDPFAAKFSASIEDILANIGDYLTFTQGEFTAENFPEVDVQYCLEPAPKTNCVHAHIYIGMKHKTNLRLNYGAILDKVKKDMDLGGVNMKNRILHSEGDAQRWVEYMTKYADGQDVEAPAKWNTKNKDVLRGWDYCLIFLATVWGNSLG